MNNNIVAKEISKTPEVWSTGKNKIEIKIDGVKNFDAIILGSGSVPDVNKVDNVYIR